MQRLADLYEEYNQLLVNNFRCDFSHLQARFLEFLGTPVGQAFCDGTSTDTGGIQWVLVDEYQDTNRIQEEIYMTLANRGDRNLVVVGDDDQAMYRFRGGSVECMVTFDDAVQMFLGLPKASVTTYPLSTNFRSHQDIVGFCDDYITSFPRWQTRRAGFRETDTQPGKYHIGCISSRSNHRKNESRRPTGTLCYNRKRVGPEQNSRARTSVACSSRVQRKPRETPALMSSPCRDKGLAVYNPRNKGFLDQEEIQCLMGAILNIVDNRRTQVPRVQRGRRMGQLIYPLEKGLSGYIQ